ncbi:MAG: hypothetical protein U1G07_01540 [Verrucomicrobiota bacterium]
MQVHTFIAESAADAVSQIRTQLGPQALVLNVRPLPPEGISRLWQKRRIEVLACIPETPPAEPAPENDPLAVLRQEMLAIRQKMECAGAPTEPIEASLPLASLMPEAPPATEPLPTNRVPLSSGDWRVGGFLETSGLLPVHAARVIEELRGVHGEIPPESFARELELAAAVLRRVWHRTAPGRHDTVGTHVLVGPPGVGKTVCLCKWLAQSVLLEGRKASVWRLDGRTANTAESLSVYGEILGVPVIRSIPTKEELEAEEGDLLFVDLPGVSAHDTAAIGQLAGQIGQLPHAQVHLVLNAAYELPLLLTQLRAFSALPLTDLIFSHLDEEPRWGKLWNFVLGTNFSVRFLSAGQNIPGDWTEATPEQILGRQFPRK